MPARASKPKRPRDVNELAHFIGKIATEGEPELPPDTRNPAAVALSQLGTSKGGKTRAAKLTAEQRREIARRAASKRWGGR
jgi:hypothetical protein